MSRRHARAAARNAAPILARLREVLVGCRTVLEIGSGTGEHAVEFARAMPWLTWQPSDPDEASRASVAAWTALASLGNVRPPLALDVLAPAWRLRRADALVAVSVLHVLPPEGAVALVSGAAVVLPRGGPLVVAGPFRRRGAPLAATQGEPLGASAPLPVLEDLVDLARAHDLVAAEITSIPDGCALAVLRRR